MSGADQERLNIFDDDDEAAENAPAELTPAKSTSSAASEGPKAPPMKTFFFNLVFAGYMVMHSCWSCAVFSAMLLFGRSTLAPVPESHDSATILQELRLLFYKEVHADLIQKIRASPAVSISLDEKDWAGPKLILSFVYAHNCLCQM